MDDLRANFGGSIPEYYDRCLGPAWFEFYAGEIAGRLPVAPPGDVLELACGTGIVTRRLRGRLAPAVRLVASDLSPAMLDFARTKLAGVPGIEWREADAACLPFADGEFGAVVCAFGIMFVPDRQQAMREARRVLKEGGLMLLAVWDRIEDNPHAAVNAAVMREIFPGDEEMAFQMPYEMHDPGLLRPLLAEAGFRETRIERKQIRVEGVSARSIALGQVRGTPRSLLIEKRGVALDEAVERVSAALAKAAGGDAYCGSASAIIIEACATA